jgi:hypothetical protein
MPQIIPPKTLKNYVIKKTTNTSRPHSFTFFLSQRLFAPNEKRAV